MTITTGSAPAALSGGYSRRDSDGDHDGGKTKYAHAAPSKKMAHHEPSNGYAHKPPC